MPAALPPPQMMGFNPTQRKVILGNIITAPFTGGLSTAAGGVLGGLLLAGMHQSGNPRIAKAVQSLFGPHPLHAGVYGSLLGYLTAKAATKDAKK